MNEKEKDQKEQESLKRYHNVRNWMRKFAVNAVVVVMCIGSLVMIIQYLMMEARTSHENEQLILCIIAFFAFLLLGGFNNFWGGKIFDKFIANVNKQKEKGNRKKRGQISNLNSALNKLSQKHGVIVWDTIWGAFFIFMLAAFIVFFQTCNKPVVLGIIFFLLLMLLGGHMIGTKINRSRHFDKKLCTYSSKYINYSSEEEYLMSIDRSVQRGVISFTGYWLLTDEYMVGRLSDIYYEPVAIPRAEIKKCVFFLLKRTSEQQGLPIGILRLELKNGKSVDLVLGRGNVCNQTLTVLNEQGIPWSKAEVRYA